MKKGISLNPFSPKCFLRYGERRYEKLKEFGFSCVDFNLVNTNTFAYTSPISEAESFILCEKELAAKSGVEFSQVHGPWRFPPKDGTVEDRSERLEKMKKSIWLTSVLGCKNWIVHPIMPFDITDITTNNYKKTWELNLNFMSELLEFAKEYGVTICLENMPFKEFSISSCKDILRFVNEINDDNFKICLDTGHVLCYEDMTPGEAVYLCADKLSTLHVHDTIPACDQHTMPYCGSVDWKEFVTSLKNAGFNGVFSWEISNFNSAPDPIFEAYCNLLNFISDEILK